MWSRSEQVQAYRFLTRRIGSAVLTGEPETNELPMRRFAFAVFGSAALAALVFAGFAVYGLLRPAGRLPVANAIIVERETGAKYLFIEGLLHPVLNWTSARLILAQAKPPVRTMSQTSLREVPRGRPVGIPDAPDALPARNGLVGLPVSVCSAPRSATSVDPASHVLVGRALAGGSPVDPAAGLLVSTGDGGGGERYLLWRNHRLRIRDNAALAALGWAGVRPARVGVAFLNAVPPGPDLAPPDLPDVGEAARVRVGGDAVDVGDMFRAADQFYVMLRDGLSPVGDVTARLAAAGGAPVTDISARDAGRVLVKTAVEPPGFPTDVPAARGGDGFAVACAVYRAGSGAEQPAAIETFATVGGDLTLTPERAAPARPGTDGVLTADRVTLPGGHAALVSAATAPGSTAPGAVYLVTDQGLKHPLPAKDAGQVQTSLGYEGVRPVPVPSIVLALVPTATALDPDAATQLAPPPTVAPAGPDG